MNRVQKGSLENILKFGLELFTEYGTHRENNVFYSIHYKNGCLAASDLFHMFTQSNKFYTFYYHIRIQVFEKGDSSNRQ